MTNQSICGKLIKLSVETANPHKRGNASETVDVKQVMQRDMGPAKVGTRLTNASTRDEQ